MNELCGPLDIDWFKITKKFNNFWANEPDDRCCLAITAPLGKRQPHRYMSLHQKWLDPEYRYVDFIESMHNTYYLGEAFPNFYANLGPSVTASFLGSDYVLGDTTVWFEKSAESEMIFSKNNLTLNENSEMWGNLIKISEFFYSKSKNRYMVGITDLGGSIDIASYLIGVTELLYAIADEPEKVLVFTEKIDNVWIEAFDRIIELNDKYQNGYTTWLPLWSHLKWYPLQCDFSVMISPETFEKFVVPSLYKISNHIGDVVYHLDGQDQLKHLDQILDIPAIVAIEWVPLPKGRYLDTGNPKWFPLYQKILDSGRRLIIRSVDPTEIEYLLSNVSHKGLFITTSCELKNEADKLFACVKKCSR